MLSLSHSTRKTLASCCFFLGSVWGVAAAFKLIFGVRITLPFFPPLDLERIAPLSAIAAALGLFALGARLGRTAEESSDPLGAELLESPTEALLTNGEMSATPASAEPTATPTHARPRSA